MASRNHSLRGAGKNKMKNTTKSEFAKVQATAMDGLFINHKEHYGH
jgi:hypothetical protein